MPVFVVTDTQDGSKKFYDIPENGKLEIGRLETQDVPLNHNKMSRRHLVVTAQGGVFKVKDNGSSNGTYLNKKRLPPNEETVIFTGDVIRAAVFEMTIRDEGTGQEDVIATDDVQADDPTPADPMSAYQVTKGIKDLDEILASEQAPSSIRDFDEESGEYGDVDDILEDDDELINPFSHKSASSSTKSAKSTTILGEEAVQEAAGGKDENGSGDNAGWKRLDSKASFSKKRLSDEERKKLDIIDEIKAKIQDRILKYMDLRNLDFTSVKADDLRQRTQTVIREIITELGGEIPRWASKKQIAKEVLDEALGLGPLEDLLADDSITEVMVNSPDQIYIERKGRLEEVPIRFSNNAAVLAVIERIVGPIGRRIDESSPMVDARLQDGSRVNAIIPPLALKGPCITIRKFSKDPFTLEDLIAFGSLNEDIALFLKAAIAARKNIIVSGGTGSGKTTLLNVLSNFIPMEERIVTVENVAELQLKQDHWIALESRPPNIEGRGEISVRDLVKNCLRMRPDRIVVGECRGGEAIDMVQAMNTGHDGSLTTAHSNSPSDTLNRIETMSLMAGLDLPSKAIRDQIMSAVDLIVHTNRFSDGSRRVTHITEIMAEVDEHYRIVTNDIFRFDQEGLDSNGKVLGEIKPTGYRPSFLRELSLAGYPVPEHLFDPQRAMNGASGRA